MKHIAFAAGLALACSVTVAHGESLCAMPASQLTDEVLEDCRQSLYRQPEEFVASQPTYDKAAEARKAAWHSANPDPGAVDLCPKPHRMTRDGCQ